MTCFDDENEPLQRFHEEINAHELVTALTGLTLLGDDLAMRSQAFNLAMVDKFIMGLEMNYLRSRFTEELPREPGSAVFLSAQTEMWIFAAYELMRSWRERAKLAIRLAENGGLGAKISHLLAKPDWDYGGRMVARQLSRVRDEPEILPRVRDDVRRSHIPFHLLEWVRVQLAKYQEPGNEKSFVRTHPMMDRETGSLNYELTRGQVILEVLSRRQLADLMRGLNEQEVPSEEAISSFENFRKARPPVSNPV
ncbi:hypothetical protein M0D47_03085 [Xanthomonas prunicola]|uniref:hypothetical protein n=1 Tax=Xanthomonas prunicola TaxID=2053930 RepID=UPI0021B49F41|nr:hypothetical protein [Xanthomonas prunicola]UXA57870.1 hypothetical protein M0D47_03085 [Xanthomonas prunicola]